jgi:hypothetical protein
MPEKSAKRGKVLFFASFDRYLDYNISENRRKTGLRGVAHKN